MNVKKQQWSVDEENCLLALWSLVETKQAQGSYMLVWKRIAFTWGNKQFFLSELMTKLRKSADSSWIPILVLYMPVACREWKQNVEQLGAHTHTQSFLLHMEKNGS